MKNLTDHAGVLELFSIKHEGSSYEDFGISKDSVLDCTSDAVTKTLVPLF